MAKKEEKKKLEGVAVGRNVHFIQSGGHTSLAFISRVIDEENGVVALYVVRDDVVRSTYFEDNVHYSEDKETGTWSFIERK